MEVLGGGKIIDCFMHCFDDRGCQRTGDVADPHLYQFRFGVGFLVGRGFVGDIRKKVTTG